MTKCHIHVGPLSPVRKECIYSQQLHLGKYDIIINEANIDLYILEMMSDLRISERPRRWYWKHQKGRVVCSDWLRFWLASKIPDFIYMDSDIEILKPFDFEMVTDEPYFGSDQCITMSNNACARFKTWLEHWRDFKLCDRIDVIGKLGTEDIIHPRHIPEDYYVHRRERIENEKWQDYYNW